MQVTSLRMVRIADRSVNTLAVGTPIVLQVSQYKAVVRIERVKLKRVAGTGANFTPRLHSDVTCTAGSITQEMAGAATAVAVLFDGTNIDGVCSTDALGRLYLVPAPDAGADNQFDYVVCLEILA